jgi:hypothetical protein
LQIDDWRSRLFITASPGDLSGSFHYNLAARATMRGLRETP